MELKKEIYDIRFIAPRLIHGGGRLTCVDISKKWMDVSRWRLGKYPNADFKLGDIATLDIPDASCESRCVLFLRMRSAGILGRIAGKMA